MKDDSSVYNVDHSACDFEAGDKIKSRLLNIQKKFDLDNLDLGFYNRKIKVNFISLPQAQERSEVYKIIAKLGLYIINDYDFFLKVVIQNTLTSELYNTAMQNLGYQRNGSSWDLKFKPTEDIIIDYIYKYCYYTFIVAQKNNQKVNSTIDKVCQFCSSEIVNRICTICGATENDMTVQHVFPENVIDNADKNDYQRNDNVISNDYYESSPDVLIISNGKNVQKIFNDKKAINDDSKEYFNSNIYIDINSNYNDHAASIESTLSWTCVHCGFNTIDQNVQNCGVCMKSRQNKPNLPENVIIDKAENLLENEAKWKCTSCTFLNEKSDKICKICLEVCLKSDGEDVDVITDLDLPEEAWLCKECRSRNSFEYYRCQNCRSIAPFFNKWKCEKCSFFNEKLDEKCEICESENINLINCSQCNKIKINKQYDQVCVQCIEKDENSRQNIEQDFYLDKENQLMKNKLKSKNKDVTNQSHKFVFRGFRSISEQTDVANSKSLSVKEISKNDAASKKSNNINQQGKVENSKICKRCKKMLKVTETHWCGKCKMNRWFCRNEACNAINFIKTNSSNQFCDKCKAKMGSDFSNCKNFDIFDKGQISQMWQCEYCLHFNAGRANKCAHCSNRRVGTDYKICLCKWVNLSVTDRCQKCDLILN